MTTTCSDRRLLVDAARVLAARPAREPLQERSPGTPSEPRCAPAALSWFDDADPTAAAAPDRLRASDAAAPQQVDRRQP